MVEIVAMEDSHRIWLLGAACQQVDKMIQLPVFSRDPGNTCPEILVYVVDLEGDGTPGVLVGVVSGTLSGRSSFTFRRS